MGCLPCLSTRLVRPAAPKDRESHLLNAGGLEKGGHPLRSLAPFQLSNFFHNDLYIASILGTIIKMSIKLTSAIYFLYNFMRLPWSLFSLPYTKPPTSPPMNYQYLIIGQLVLCFFPGYILDTGVTYMSCKSPTNRLTFMKSSPRACSLHTRLSQCMGFMMITLIIEPGSSHEVFLKHLPFYYSTRKAGANVSYCVLGIV